MNSEDRFSFLDKTFGLLAASFFAWMVITTIFVISLGIILKTPMSVFLYFFGIVGIPISMIVCLVLGHIGWFILDLTRFRSAEAHFVCGAFIGSIFLYGLITMEEQNWSFGPGLFVLLLLSGVIGGFSAIIARNYAEKYSA